MIRKPFGSSRGEVKNGYEANLLPFSKRLACLFCDDLPPSQRAGYS
jgi:hypothetical protein